MPPTETEDATMAVVLSKLEGVASQISDLSVKMDDRPTWEDMRRIERGWEERLSAAVRQRETVTRHSEQRINTLEAWQLWAGRLVGGTVVTGIIGAFFVLRP